ncbi:aldose 1-epimerase family protein [Clostridium hydrogenum]|uniref:aldose 1-epimerase family protein n=1 Tax=Clostridium hydrogenum TaxID=2855764 RepID=UPI001F40A43C|nr:aldose 1-epimerase family protein [Clostridium hydrogenum]
MTVKLQNDVLTIEVSEKGAELTSIKANKNNDEYLWTANSEFWGRHAPILFPIVGKVKNDTYRIGENTFNLTQHGFARDMEFKAVEKDSDKVILKLSWNEETLKIYPYKFELKVQYKLAGDNVEISYNVKNLDNGDIYFSIGAHPGFNCPVIGEEDNLKFEDYYFEFKNRENVDIIHINQEGLVKRNSAPFLYDSNIIHLSRQLFKKDALIFKDLCSNEISLKNIKNSKAVTLKFEGFPYLGLWSKPTGAPFVCIEPWFGHADYEDFDGDFREKDGILKLQEKEEFNCKYSIQISE